MWSCSAQAANLTFEEVRAGRLSPVFFGSALTNFGVEPFLEEFLRMTPSPLPREADCGVIDTFSPDFSAFVFKIQANMNKAHRDRLAFMRICSGQFQRDAEYYHVQSGKKMRLSQPQQLMASEREIVDEAYAGDIIGVFDPGIFLHRRHHHRTGQKVQIRRHPDLRAGALRPRQRQGLHEAQAVPQGNRADRAGGRDPDLQGAEFRHGGGHCRRRRHAAVRRFPVPHEGRIRRRPAYAAAAV